MAKTRTYFCIDMKSFYASVECAERGYNPFETNLVVADLTRGKNALCLAITPAMKAQGIRNRCRLSEIPSNVKYEVAPPRMALYIEYAADIYSLYLDYRVKFGIPATNLATKGDSITFSTPTIEGTILRRNKADAGGKHPWKAEALEGDVTAATITNWYKEVYEPTYTTTPEKQG